MPDHERTVLFEREFVLFIRRILFDKVEEVEVSFGISFCTFVVFEFEEADPAMVVLKRFELKHHARFDFNRVFFILARFVFGLRLIIGKQAFIAVWTLTVWPSGHLHLENAHFDPKLDFLPTVHTLDFAYTQLAGVVWPTVKKWLYVFTHLPYPSASSCKKAPDESGAPSVFSVR